ncbi:MAG: hypothetical protein AAGJ46_09995 [Planctomycetota bacterium]
MRAKAPVFLAALSALCAGGALAPDAWGQTGQPYPVNRAVHAAPPMAPPGVVQAFQPGDPLVDAHGDRAVIPAQYCPPGGYGYGGGGAYDGAYGAPSYATDSAGLRYFDVACEFVSYTRDDIFKNRVDFTSLGFTTDGTPPNIIMSSDDVSLGYEPGFRLTGRYDVGALSVLEIGYMGIFDMTSSTQVRATTPSSQITGNLFSPFTNFGGGFLPESVVDPLEGGFNPDNLEEFEETDRATVHAMTYTSDLQNAEISYRRYWVGRNPRVSGTWLAGFRYTKLNESFSLNTVGNDFERILKDPDNPAAGSDPPTAPPRDPNDPPGVGTSTYQIITDNDLAGFQTGGDIWVAVVQGLRVGAETKFGLFNNDYELQTVFSTSDNGIEQLYERTGNDQAAFIGELKFMMVADILPNMSIRGGYEVLFMNSLALVGPNYNPGSPYVFTGADLDGDGVGDPATDVVPPRDEFRLDQGNVAFHGWTLGFEYIW